MFLSICIPTFNRASCLKKTLQIYLDQVNLYGYHNVVEFNISDNASLDDTQNVVRDIANRNKGIKIVYKRNNTNLGPDKNFIQAMNMATGEYSILWSDDDYLREGALEFIINTLKENPKASIFLSNRNRWIDGKIDDGIEYFINKSVNTRYYDFSNEDEIFSYFSCVTGVGGLFTYIPSVIYKTEVVKLYDYDNSLDGTYYSFMFYWWQYLMEGRLLMYLNTSYIDCTISRNVKNENFGEGIYRVLVDYEGLVRVAKMLKISGLVKEKFLACLSCSYNIPQLVNLRIYTNRNLFDLRMIPILRECGLSDKDIKTIVDQSSIKRTIANLIALCCLPLFRCISKILSKFRCK